MLATLLLTLRGTPYLYQGDEIGMTNAPFDTLDDFVDVNTRADVHRKLDAGADREEVLQQHRRIGRDNARTPMQWEASAHGGFTDGTPWLAVNPNCETINVTAAREEPNSVSHYYRRLIALRHRHNGLIYGTYDLLMPDHPTIYAYRRTLDNDALLVSLNFAAEDVAYRPSNKGPIEAGTRLVGNYSEADAVDEVTVLRPYEARGDDFQT